jgi:hypothetical protein
MLLYDTDRDLYFLLPTRGDPAYHSRVFCEGMAMTKAEGTGTDPAAMSAEVRKN